MSCYKLFLTWLKLPAIRKRICKCFSKSGTIDHSLSFFPGLDSAAGRKFFYLSKIKLHKSWLNLKSHSWFLFQLPSIVFPGTFCSLWTTVPLIQDLLPFAPLLGSLQGDRRWYDDSFNFSSSGLVMSISSHTTGNPYCWPWAACTHLYLSVSYTNCIFYVHYGHHPLGERTESWVCTRAAEHVTSLVWSHSKTCNLPTVHFKSTLQQDLLIFSPQKHP